MKKQAQIAIDVRMARHTGIGRYIRGFISKLSVAPPFWNYVLVGRSSTKTIFSPQIHFRSLNVPIYSVFEQVALPLVANSYDCLHIPHYNIPVAWPKKLVVTIHDLIHFEFSKDLNPFAVYYAKFFLPLAVKRADAIIAVSESTKKDLVEKLNVKPEKITVIYHGIDPVFLQPEQSVKSGNQDPYFLYVGLIKSHKNLGLLLKAFKEVKRKLGMDNLSLRIVGRPDPKQKIVGQWLRMIEDDRSIHLISRVPDQELKKIYANAIALVFPSLYEGFGFPLLEAMASRIPIIAANSTSIPEVLSEHAGLLFDPGSQSELESCMEKIIKNKNLRQTLIDEGQKRLTLFDWKAAAGKAEKVYESVLYSN